MKIQKNILFQTENIHIIVNDQNTFDLARLGNSFTKMQKKKILKKKLVQNWNNLSINATLTM